MKNNNLEKERVQKIQTTDAQENYSDAPPFASVDVTASRDQNVTSHLMKHVTNHVFSLNDTP